MEKSRDHEECSVFLLYITSVHVLFFQFGNFATALYLGKITCLQMILWKKNLQTMESSYVEGES